MATSCPTITHHRDLGNGQFRNSGGNKNTRAQYKSNRRRYMAAYRERKKKGIKQRRCSGRTSKPMTRKRQYTK